MLTPRFEIHSQAAIHVRKNGTAFDIATDRMDIVRTIKDSKDFYVLPQKTGSSDFRWGPWGEAACGEGHAEPVVLAVAEPDTLAC